MEKNLYEELGLKKNATKSEIKSSYRSLVKIHHPDAGGKKEQYDKNFFSSSSFDSLNENWEEKFNSKKHNSSIKDKEVETWIKEIYSPINRLISQIIKPLNNEIRELSADPYDDQLMENFCSYIILSQKKIEKVEKIYNKKIVPKSISALSLSLIHI